MKRMKEFEREHFRQWAVAETLRMGTLPHPDEMPALVRHWLANR